MKTARALAVLAVAVALWASAAAAQTPARSPSPGPASRPPQPGLTVVAAKPTGDVSFRRGGAEWAEVNDGQELTSSDELHTGPESQVTLRFSDGSVLVVKELTQMMIGTLLSGKDKLKVELFLKLGEVKAQVKHQETVRTDFSIRTPTATASVRGTDIEHVRFHPQTGMETQLTSGLLLIDTPQGSVMNSPGDESQVNTDGGLSTPLDMTQEDSRTHAEPLGLTQPEIQQINLTNQPQAVTPQGGGTTSTGASTAGTLIFRVVLQ